jgi:hypothetical protein
MSKKEGKKTPRKCRYAKGVAPPMADFKQCKKRVREREQKAIQVTKQQNVPRQRRCPN